MLWDKLAGYAASVDRHVVDTDRKVGLMQNLVLHVAK